MQCTAALQEGDAKRYGDAMRYRDAGIAATQCIASIQVGGICKMRGQR